MANRDKELWLEKYPFGYYNSESDKGTGSEVIECSKPTFEGWDDDDSDFDWDENDTFTDDDFMSDEEADYHHANLYGGDTTYCVDCGTKKVYGEDGYSYCPDCAERAGREWHRKNIDFKEDRNDIFEALDEACLNENRECTIKVREMLEDGIISYESVARMCLAYLSEDDAEDIATTLIDDDIDTYGNSRQYTNALLDMCEEGLLSWETLVGECLAYMSEDDVCDMAHSNELIDEEEDATDATEVDTAELADNFRDFLIENGFREDCVTVNEKYHDWHIVSYKDDGNGEGTVEFYDTEGELNIYCSDTFIYADDYEELVDVFMNDVIPYVEYEEGTSVDEHSEYDDLGIDTRTGKPFGTHYDVDAPEYDDVDEYEDLEEGWSHFEYTSGANPYIAKTEEEKKRICNKYGKNCVFKGNINGNDYYVINDKTDSDFAPVEELKESILTNDGYVTPSEGAVEQFLNKYGFGDDRYQKDVYTDNASKGKEIIVSFTDGISASDYRVIEKHAKEFFGQCPVEVRLGKEHKDGDDLWATLVFDFGKCQVNEDLEGRYCIVARTLDGKFKFYKDGAFVDNYKEATIFTDMDEARAEWFDIDRSRYKRVFIPNYDESSFASLNENKEDDLYDYKTRQATGDDWDPLLNQENPRRSNAPMSLKQKASIAYKNNDEDFFYSLSDDELVTLWVSCSITGENPFGAAYDDEVYGAIADRPNSRELFDRATEIIVNKMPMYNLAKVYARYYNQEPNGLPRHKVVADVLNAIKNHNLRESAKDAISKKSNGDYLVRANGGYTVFNRHDVAIGGIDDEDAETEQIAINKFQSNQLSESVTLNEGPGAGYTLSGRLKINKVESLTPVKFEDCGEFGYTGSYDITFNCVAIGTISDFEFQSYMYGDKIDSAEVEVTGVKVNFYAENGIDDIESLVKSNLNHIAKCIVGASVSVDHLYGGGWSHSTFDGTVSEFSNNVKDSYNDSFRLINGGVWGDIIYTELFDLEATIKDTDVIEYVDRAVTGDNFSYMYTVIDEDGNPGDAFFEEDDAIEYAKKHHYQAVDKTECKELFGGETEYLDSEIVWENDEDMNESLSDRSEEYRSAVSQCSSVMSANLDCGRGYPYINNPTTAAISKIIRRYHIKQSDLEEYNSMFKFFNLGY